MVLGGVHLALNLSELMAISGALDQLESLVSDPVLWVVSDNAMVVIYFYVPGCMVSQVLCCLSERTLLRMHQRDVFTARHLAGVSNVVADLLSRSNSIVNTEWAL